jgi:hypothetical protein
MTKMTKRIPTRKSAVLALAACGALAVPAAVHGKPDKPPKDKPAKGVSYVFKGVYSGDGSTVAVDHTNKHARDYEGPVEFDFGAAKIKAKDASGNESSDLADASGDRVVVKAKLPRRDPGEQPFPARQLVEQTPSYEAEAG